MSRAEQSRAEQSRAEQSRAEQSRAEQSRGRDIHIDFLRILAIVTVVLCHAVEEVYRWDVNFINNLSIQSRVFAFAAFTVGRLGVPIFMFITGYLLLDRDFDDVGIKKFWKKNLLPLLATTEIWILLYDIFLKFYYSQPFKWSVFIKNILFLEQVRMGHMWYMSMIIGVYLFLPFVARALKNVRFHVLIIPLAIGAICLTIVPLINIVLIVFKKTGIWSILSLDFSGGYYGLIFILGYLYKRFGRLDDIKGYYAIVVGVAAYILVVALQLFFFSNGMAYPAWYHWFPLIITSSCLAIVAMKISKRIVREDNDLLCNLGKCAFGVYLVHFPLLMTLNRYFPLQGMLPIKVIYLFVVGLVMSYGIVLSFSRFDRIRTLLFYIK